MVDGHPPYPARNYVSKPYFSRSNQEKQGSRGEKIQKIRLNLLKCTPQNASLVFCSVHFTFYVSTMRSMQSPHRMLTLRVARTLWPHLGQMSLRVELGRLPPVVSAPGWTVPPAPVQMMDGKVLRPSDFSPGSSTKNLIFSEICL